MEAGSGNSSMVSPPHTKMHCVFVEVLPFPATGSSIVTAIITCVINVLAAITAVSGNLMVLLAFVRTKELRTTSNIVLLSLVCSDFLVGFVVDPLYLTRQILALTTGQQNCPVWVAYLTTGLFCAGASCLNLMMITLERCIAIFSPFNYLRFFSTPRAVICMAIVWCLWITLTLLRFFGLSNKVVYLICFAVMITSYCVTGLAYFFIFKETRRHQKRIRSEQQSASSAVVREAKLAKTVAYIFGALLFCYAPGMVILVVRSVTGDNPVLFYTYYPWAENLIFLNSSVNPAIYCWRNRDIRRSVLRGLRLRSRNRIEILPERATKERLQRAETLPSDVLSA